MSDNKDIKGSELLPPGVKITPMLEQYTLWKSRYPGYLLFFRMGDFFELFFDDAKTASETLDIALTARDQGKIIPMAGVPHHAIEAYLGRLVEAGYRVAVCDQVTEPDGRGIVEREVTRLVTPGTFVPAESGNEGVLMAVCPHDDQWAVSFISMATGRFEAGTFPAAEARSLVMSYAPREVIVPKGRTWEAPEDVMLCEREADMFYPRGAQTYLMRHFGLLSLEGLGFEHGEACVGAAGAALRYAEETQFGRIGHVCPPVRIRPQHGLLLDSSSQRNLELVEGRGPTLYSVLNRCATPMGRRRLKHWIMHPLNNLEEIAMRHDGVAALLEEQSVWDLTEGALGGLPDGERAFARLHMGTGGPRELGICRDVLRRMPDFCTLGTYQAMTPWVHAPSEELVSYASLIGRALSEVPPKHISDGGAIAQDFDHELDELLDIRDHSDRWLKEYEENQREALGIKALKVGSNRVFGYYIDVPRSYSGEVPESYRRRQTLAGSERYITDELKSFEQRRMGADEAVLARESHIYAQLMEETGRLTREIQAFMSKAAELDVILSFARSARERRYVRPQMTCGEAIDIKMGRHPVVEAALGEGVFTPNDLYLDGARNRVVLLTGPNMAGKSTWLRMGAIIVLMGHMGSFVPAESALLCRTDRLFTRIGARDDIARGQSTFMVEMVETAQILNSLSARSLVILDEIGRGTSTDDGMSIAWAITEYLHAQDELRPKVMFATHYHELTALSDILPGVCNFSMAVEESPAGITFLHHVVPKAASRSYGVDVARLAGLPQSVLRRSSELLARFEARRRARCEQPEPSPPRQPRQMSLFGLDVKAQAIVDRLAVCEPDNMTPMQALELVALLHGEAREIVL